MISSYEMSSIGNPGIFIGSFDLKKLGATQMAYPIENSEAPTTAELCDFLRDFHARHSPVRYSVCDESIKFAVRVYSLLPSDDTNELLDLMGQSVDVMQTIQHPLEHALREPGALKLAVAITTLAWSCKSVTILDEYRKKSVLVLRECGLVNHNDNSTIRALSIYMSALFAFWFCVDQLDKQGTYRPELRAEVQNSILKVVEVNPSMAMWFATLSTIGTHHLGRSRYRSGTYEFVTE